MTSQKVFDFNEINLKHFTYEKPQKKGQSYFSNLSYKQHTPIHLITPKLRCLSSISDIISNKSSTIDVELISKDHAFYDFFTNLDLKNVQTTFSNSEQWFGKEIPIELIDDMYKRTNKPIKKDEKPKLSFKLPFYKEQLQCPIYNQTNDLINIDNIEPNIELSMCLHIKGLKILRSTYYCDIYVSQIKVFQKQNKYNLFKECVFSKDISKEVYENENDLIDTEYISQLQIKKESELEELKKSLLSIQDKKNTHLEEIKKLDSEVSEILNKINILNGTD